uniref:protein BIG GRAIN 1-like B n=1 Tax=Erigeron canadensis TaxID=72917 RepID=UPI001CB95758|nr:protein BIG GRAIN 1-like B [Erigeron canadensis]
MDVTSSRRYKENPSFSSSLLDEIYRSIDERDFEQTSNVCSKERRKVQVITGRRSAADVDRNSIRNENGCSFRYHSSSSSCDINSSISQNELIYGAKSKPKAISTTSFYQHDDQFDKRAKERHNMCKYDDIPQAKAKNEGKFVKTKSKALKIYSDLKKVKQPISPGGRLTRLLNSIFTNGNSKKMNGSSGCSVRDIGSGTETRSHLDRKSKSANASTCSSASSFSRSCLSNTPSSRGKLSSETKRSVRFYPVSVIVGEDCQPRGHKSLYENETRLESVEFAHKSIHDKKRDISEAARKLLKNYQKKVERKFESIRNNEDEEQSDDDKSDSSSDLFELDNLSTIGMSKYREELPVYETTHLDTNQAIANGLFM